MFGILLNSFYIIKNLWKGILVEGVVDVFY